MKRLALAVCVLTAGLMGGFFVGALGAFMDDTTPDWPEW